MFNTFKKFEYKSKSDSQERTDFRPNSPHRKDMYIYMYPICIQIYKLYMIPDCGPGSSIGKVLGYGLGWHRFNPGCRRGGDFSSLLHVQTGPGIHSASYKMSAGGLSPRAKTAEHRISHPTSS